MTTKESQYINSWLLYACCGNNEVTVKTTKKRSILFLNEPLDNLAEEFQCFSQVKSNSPASITNEDIQAQGFQALFASVQTTGEASTSHLNDLIALLPITFHKLEPRQLVYSHALPCSVSALHDIAYMRPDIRTDLKDRVASAWTMHPAFGQFVRVVIYYTAKMTRCLELQTAVRNNADLTVRSVLFFIDYIHDFYAETTLLARDEGIERCTIRHRARLCRLSKTQTGAVNLQKKPSWKRVHASIKAWEQDAQERIRLFPSELERQYSSAGIRSLFSPHTKLSSSESETETIVPVLKTGKHAPCCLIS